LVVVISESDIVKMTEACRELPAPSGDYLIDDFLTNLMATVIDFQTHTSAVERALRYFAEQVRPKLTGLQDLIQIMESWPADQTGNTLLARHLWGYAMWTRAQMLRDLVAHFTRIDVTDQASLRAWAERATFEHDFKGKVSGLGPAVFQWLIMRQGVDTVKPDVHVHRFVSQALGRRLNDTDVVAVIVGAAHRLNRPAHRLDWAIWEVGRARGLGALSRVKAANPGGRGTSAGPALQAKSDLRGRVSDFLDDDARYISWVAAHTAGYVINTGRIPSPGYLILHRATCHTMNPRHGADKRTWTVSYRKLCATDAYDLVSWAETHVKTRPKACKTCKP
jgi:hypothetical protein